MLDPRIEIAKGAVESALKDIEEANARYIAACKHLADVKMDVARETPHPWLGMTVYRIMKGEGVRHREERGVVCFKEYADPDYGNSHIQPGTHYVLVGGKTAHWLDESWMLDLL